MGFKLLKIVLILIFMGISSQALAQSAKDMEESAFILCQDRLGTSTEAEACIDWITEGVCRSPYLSRIEQVAKLTSNDNLRKYREAAEQRLPATCEPMSAVILNLDILKDMPKTEDKARFKRWERAFHWAPGLAPQQRQILAAEAADAPEFAQMLNHTGIKNHLLQAAAESAELLPDISEKTLFFLHQLEQIRPDLMTPEMHAVLLSDALNRAQYKMASSRLDQLDIAQLSEDLKNRFMPVIANAAVQLFGRADLSQAVCFRESPAMHLTLPKLAWIQALDIPKVKGLISGHLMTLWLMQCDDDAISTRLADLWLNYPADPNLHSLTDALLKNIETHRNVLLGIRIAKTMGKLDGKARETFQKQYGLRLFSSLFEAGLLALDIAPSLTIQALEAAAPFAPTAREMELQFHLGRSYAASQNGTKARQIWAQMIDKDPKTSWTMKAAYLSILSFQKAGKKSEAQALFKRMEAAGHEMPGLNGFKL
jgi:hypothetical protein